MKKTPKKPTKAPKPKKGSLTKKIDTGLTPDKAKRRP